jgi:PTS system nitrogen regulatory IIA component
MDLEQLASYLQRDARELGRLASRGRLPGHKVGGEWRFAQAEINYWLETQLPNYTAEELTALERGAAGSDGDEQLVSQLLSERTIAIPLQATTRPSVLRAMVHLAEGSWNVYDPAILLHAIEQREEQSSTAIDLGVAILHPRRAQSSKVLGDSVMALGIIPGAVPFGAPLGGLTDVFFLVACTDAATHLRVLTRLSRLFLLPNFLDDLRIAEAPADAIRILADAERRLHSEE